MISKELQMQNRELQNTQKIHECLNRPRKYKVKALANFPLKSESNRKIFSRI